MKASEAINVFERSKETGFCVSLRGFAKCVGVVPSTVIYWKNNPEKEIRGIDATKVQYVKEEVEKFEPEFVDWSAFRREAAKDILPSVIEKASEIYEFESLVKDVWCKQAVEWADELIKQLKQE